MNICRLALITLSLTLFAACGGGGGGSSASGGITPEPLPLLPITNTERAIDLVEGSEVTSTMTSMEIEQALRSRADAADNLISSDILNILETGVERREVSCTGVICTGTINDGTNIYNVHVSLDDFGGTPEIDDEDLVGYNSRYSLVMMDGGATIWQGQAAGRLRGASFQYQSYGGWLDNSVFGVEAETATNGTDTLIVLSSYSFGNDSGTNPTGTTRTDWNGVMVGASEEGHVIQGDARITIEDFSDPKVDVEFSKIRNLDTRAIVINMGWNDLTLTDGNFSHQHSLTGSIQGTFYGATHDEVGGIFDRDDIIGAFGAAK